MILFRQAKKHKIGSLRILLLGGVFIVVLLLLHLQLVNLATPHTSKTQHVFGVANTSIDFTSQLKKLDPNAIGMDISGYGYPYVLANDQTEQQKLKTLQIHYMRIDLQYSIPGDPTSKIICGGITCDTRWSGDQWIQAIKAIGAEPVIVVHYNALDDANMVKHFNRDTHNTVHYWIVGNEPDLHGMAVNTYSSNFNHDYDAMKAVDPTIKIGGGTTAWYDRPFLRAFLQQCGSRIDFVDFHGYAQKGDKPGNYKALFQIAADFGQDIHNLRALIQKMVPTRASHISIEIGEWELDWGGYAQNNTNFHAVWTASTIGHIVSAGGWSLFYADKENALYGTRHTIIDAQKHTINVTIDDPTPAYQGIGMFTGEGLFQHFGDMLVKATTTLPDVEVYASDNPKNIVLINKSPSITRTVNINLKGVVTGTVDVWRKDASVLFSNPPVKLATLSVQDNRFAYQLPPFSVTTVVLHTSLQTASMTVSPRTLEHKTQSLLIASSRGASQMFASEARRVGARSLGPLRASLRSHWLSLLCGRFITSQQERLLIDENVRIQLYEPI
jgi:hypothetical protein